MKQYSPSETHIVTKNQKLSSFHKHDGEYLWWFQMFFGPLIIATGPIQGCHLLVSSFTSNDLYMSEKMSLIVRSLPWVQLQHSDAYVYFTKL